MAALALWGCGSHAPGHRAGPSPAPVEITTVALDSSVTGALVLPARISAREEVLLTARIAGRVSRLLAHEGEAVRPGQPLVSFDAPESRSALAAARSELEAATLAQAVAHRQAARMESLFAAGVAASREQEVAASAGRNSTARLLAARSALEGLDAALTIRAPFAGVIARRLVDPGADVAAGAPLLSVRSAGGTEIVVALPEAVLPAIPSARFSFLAGTQDWRPARLLRIEGITDFTTRTRTARLVADGGSEPAPGAFARVRLESPELPDPPLPVLPASSIVRRGALTGAFVIEDGRAVLRWLKLGREMGGTVEVLSGLFPGERVSRVAAGLADGAPVRARP